MQESICSSVRKAGAYTVLSDELAIIVRYADVEAVKLFEHFLTSTYVHCYAHCLNLVLVDSIKNVSPLCLI